MRVIDPLGYLEFMGLVRGAHAVVTDSGGVQEEDHPRGAVPHPSPQHVRGDDHAGTNELVTRANLAEKVRAALAAGRQDEWPTPPLWDGHAGERIAEASKLPPGRRELP
jgi:UDP-N-acetylglucosamine 2-epimerase (non-hydrolysing)